ncbi:purine nucleoside permease [Suhomyces tanzawaensis NRRL Y-17324]|uniref:Purine nucleoside permease n=1 Tax=Suhomyces tanzawaensis NRRL Y-17324 TaxID=984487 RepID=A0A1E4SHS5_9ASCO|nr:purine nucleoside permease [Suhomyces tanzawaensis NRRL Y-17324]ODV79068.1 purine nucleoside permease [Suhomyces tanzawaensis NRRL Y-17324]
MIPTALLWLAFAVSSAAQVVLSPKYEPKVFIVTMFQPEEEAWTSRVSFPKNIKVPGLSPIYPHVRCVEDYSICHFTTGEGEINAAASMAFLLSSPKFDFSKTYWLLAGIAGGEPSKVTTGLVTFAKYAIQIGLQYQVDPTEIPKKYLDWPSGYFSYGTRSPTEYPDAVYGTEVFELNGKLRDRAVEVVTSAGRLARGNELNDRLRKLYTGPARGDPEVCGCDVLTSDNYFTGSILSDYFLDYSNLISNGTANYCSAAQEDNASLEAFIRMAQYGVVDFERIVVMRTISNFVRPPALLQDDPIDFFLDYPKGGFQVALDNLYYGGWPFVQDIIQNWTQIYNTNSLRSENYIGDILGTLGGKPDFGKDSYKISSLL